MAADQYGYQDYVFKIFGNFGYLYATEPLKNASNPQLKWGSTEVRFHTPAEHIIQGTQYDMEMQIFLDDVDSRALFCSAHKAALSLMFTVDDTSTSSFFDWIADAQAGNEISVSI